MGTTRPKTRSRKAPDAKARPVPQAATRSHTQPARPDLNGGKAIAANVCYYCGGPLRAADGSFSERLVESGGRAFAAAICNTCKRSLKEEDEE